MERFVFRGALCKKMCTRKYYRNNSTGSDIATHAKRASERI